MNPINRIYSEDKRAPKEINLKELFRTIKKRIWVVLILIAVFIGAGWFYSSSNKTVPLYETSTNVIVQADSESRKTLQVIIKDPSTLEKVIERLNLKKSPQALASQIETENIESSRVIHISVTDLDPVRAAEIANTTAAVFKESVPKMIELEEMTIVSEAKVNPVPINEDNQKKIIIAAAILGTIVGVGLILLIDSLDETVKSERDIETLMGIQVIGSVSKMTKRNVQKKRLRSEKLELRGETIGYK